MTAEEDGADVLGLVFSQQTFASTQGSFASSFVMERGSNVSRKRTYEEEAEEEIDVFFDEVDAEEATEQQMMMNHRPIAKMKGKLGKASVGGSVTVVGEDLAGEDDFEEASFLAPMEVDGL